MTVKAVKRPGTAVLAMISAITLAACGETVSTGSFKGEQGAVAKRISQFQSDATKGDQKAICRNDLAAAARTRLGHSESDCQHALNDQLTQVETFALTISSITITGTSATAAVKSTYSGKTRSHTLTLVKEAGGWRISGVA
ncbi:MAG TPA: nuclear transport factor 2 family protein [Solirubrobacteraceae bacterium]|jgi:hypothetical protein